MSEMADPWVVQAPKQVAQVPDGAYLASFKAVKEVTIKDPKTQADSPKWRFSWEVKTGEHAGKEASALTDQNILHTTLLGRLISGLLGRAIVPGENVKAAIEACIGKTYLVVVAPGPKGGKSGVKTCSQPPAM